MTTSPISDQTIIEVFADNPESVSSAYEQVAQLATNGIHPLIIIEVFHNYHKQPVPVVTERLIALGCKPYDDNPARDAVFFHRG